MSIVRAPYWEPLGTRQGGAMHRLGPAVAHQIRKKSQASHKPKKVARIRHKSNGSEGNWTATKSQGAKGRNEDRRWKPSCDEGGGLRRWRRFRHSLLVAREVASVAGRGRGSAAHIQTRYEAAGLISQLSSTLISTARTDCQSGLPRLATRGRLGGQAAVHEGLVVQRRRRPAPPSDSTRISMSYIACSRAHRRAVRLTLPHRPCRPARACPRPRPRREPCPAVRPSQSSGQQCCRLAVETNKASIYSPAHRSRLGLAHPRRHRVDSAWLGPRPGRLAT